MKQSTMEKEFGSQEETITNLNQTHCEMYRSWMETAGDLDDFIFYQSESAVSER